MITKVAHPPLSTLSCMFSPYNNNNYYYNIANPECSSSITELLTQKINASLTIAGKNNTLIWSTYGNDMG